MLIILVLDFIFSHSETTQGPLYYTGNIILNREHYTSQGTLYYMGNIYLYYIETNQAYDEGKILGEK